LKKKSLKILFISNDKFPPFRVDVAVLFGKEMVRKGHQIDWVLQSENDNRYCYRTQWGGGTAWVGPTNNGTTLIQRLHKHLLGFMHNIRHIKLLFLHKYHCIQLKDRFFSSIIYLTVANALGIKCFYWLSYPFAEASLYQYRTKSARYPIIYLLRGMIYKWMLYKFIMQRAAHIFVQSEQMKKDVENEGVAKNKMTVIPMGFDAESIDSPLHTTYPAEAIPEKKVVYLGTLNRIRKIDFVVRMFDRVLQKIPEARLYLIGKADTKEDIDALKNEAKDLGILKFIVFTGFIERGRAFELVKSADVCLSPFFPTPVLNSTSPTKLIEYMALGKPVVANDHPEQQLVIRESGAGICVPYREKDFADAVAYLLTHPESNIEMGTRGRDWIYKNRSYRIISELVERTYIDKLSNEG
jgi:glycosyltransferase involved in cell wall biosynthesis